MTRTRYGSGVTTVVTWLLILGTLNALLSFHNLWPTLWIRPVRELSLDLLIALLTLALAIPYLKPPWRGLRVTLLVLLVVFIVGRYLQVTAPALFGRKIDIYWDIQHLPAVSAMWLETQPFGERVVLLVVLVLAIVLSLWLLDRCIRWVLENLREPLARYSIIIACVAALSVYAAGRASDRWASEHWFSVSVGGMLGAQIDSMFTALTGNAPLPPPPTHTEPRNDWLRNQDIAVLFIESYGAITVENDSLARALAPRYRSLARAAKTHGWFAASGWFDSPTFGGGSWLAHSSVLSGSFIDSQSAYRQILHSARPTLPKVLGDLGYRSIAVFPGMKKAWPEGRFYGFERIDTLRDIDYDGPEFGWWTVPDQYTFAWLQARYLDPPSHRPRFIVCAAVMSHSPFRPTPPYLDDWQRLRAERPAYTVDEQEQAIAVAETREPIEHYRDAIDYELASVSGWLGQLGPRPLLLIVLGDHQPPAFISGPTASRRVPVHVFSRDRTTIEPLIDAGFAPGVQAHSAHIGTLNRLFTLILSGRTS